MLGSRSIDLSSQPIDLLSLDLARSAGLGSNESVVRSDHKLSPPA